MLLTEKTRLRILLIPGLAVAIAAAIAAPALTEGPRQVDDTASRERAQAALRKAVEFYRTKVVTEGGYQTFADNAGVLSAYLATRAR